MIIYNTLFKFSMIYLVARQLYTGNSMLHLHSNTDTFMLMTTTSTPIKKKGNVLLPFHGNKNANAPQYNVVNILVSSSRQQTLWAEYPMKIQDLHKTNIIRA